MKKAFLFMSIAAMLMSCGNNTKQTEEKKGKCCCETEVSAMSVDSFLVVAENYVGIELNVQGTVEHVCKHGGKRVRIFSACPSKSIHGVAAEGVGPFNAELEGSNIIITGTVVEDKIDMAYVIEWEEKTKEAMAKDVDESDMEHKAGADHHASLEKLAQYRKDIEASKKGYIAFYSLDVTKFNECTSKKAPCASSDSTKVAATTVAPCGGVKAAPCGEKEAKKCAGEKATHDHAHDHAGHKH